MEIDQTRHLLNPARQLAHGLFLAPAAVGKMSARAWGRAAIYALLAALVLGAVGGIFASQQTSLRRLLESFLFPDGYRPFVDFFLEYVVKSQTKQVVANALVTFTMFFVSLTLFWAKERLSRTFEADAGLQKGEWRELSFAHEAFEEIKLLLLNVALLFFVLWLGHSAETWRKTMATVLSYGVMFFTWAVDFAAPYMQRRRLRYSQIMAAIFRRPFLSFGFGAAMSLPLAAVAHVAGAAEWPATTTVVVLFAANVLMIVWAAVAGTWVGSQLFELAERVRPMPRWVQVPFWVVLLGWLGAGAFVAVNLAGSLATKSQILKCEYRVDWSTVVVGKPKLAGLARGEIRADVSVEITITNPNPIDVVIEKNRLVVRDDEVTIAESRLSPVAVPAGESRRERVSLDAVVRGKSVLEGASLNPLAWDVVFYIEVSDGFEFPIYLRAGR